MKTAGMCAPVALVILAPTISGAETFEILSPPGATGRVQPTVIHSGIVAGNFQSGVNVLAFMFSRSGGYTVFDVPDHRFFAGVEPAGMDRSGRIYGSFTNNDRDEWSFVREASGDIQTFAFPAPGVRFTVVQDVDSRGASVGRYSAFDENIGILITQGFMRLETGQIVQLRYPDSSITVATGNNDKGEIVGYTGFNGQIAYQPFFRDAFGSWTLFGLPPGCMAPDLFGGSIHLNKSGTAAGHCAVAQETFHGFIRAKNGELKRFKVPGSISTSVVGVADNGNVAGTYTDAAGSHAYIRRSIATYVKFDAPTDAPGFTFVTDYSANGDLAGTFEDSDHVSHGFVRYKE